MVFDRRSEWAQELIWLIAETRYELRKMMALTDDLAAANTELTEAVAENATNFGALQATVKTLTDQVAALEQQVAAGSSPDPAVVAAVAAVKTTADAVKAQADSFNPAPVAPADVPPAA